MRLEKWALVAEIVGAIAIVISLLFVGLQVRQSNSLAATDALKEGTRIWTDAYVAAFGTEESTEFFRKAVNSCDTLSPAERGRLFGVMVNFVSAYDNIFNQYTAGRLREDTFVSIAAAYYGIASTPCAQRVLVDQVPLLPPYLTRPDVVPELVGHEGDIKLFDFLLQ
jgi:hypothetical protein